MADLSEQTRQALLSTILDSAGDAVIAIDEDQTIVFFNRAAERTFGYTAGEVLGQSLALLLPAAVASGHQQHVRRFVAHGPASDMMTDRLPVYGRRKDGSEFPAETSISTLTHQGRTLLVAIARDITLRRQAQDALADSEERYRSIVSAMAEGVVLQDGEGRIIACNESAERILGLSREQLMGLTSYDPRWRAIHEDGSPTIGDDHPIVVTRRTGRPQANVVMGVHRPDGSLVWVSVNTQPLFHPGEARPYAVVASFTDISEQRRAERALRESEARFRALFENSTDGVLLTAPTGEILAANPAACRLLQRTEAEICRLGRAGVVDAADPRLPGALAERARAGQARSELTLIRGDGSRFPAELASAVFSDQEGNLRTSIVFRDITERVRAYQLLEQRVVERTNELAALLEVGREVASTLALEPLLGIILTHLKTVVDYTSAGIAILKDGELEMLDCDGPLPCQQIVGARLSLDDVGCRRVVRERAPVIVADVWAEEPWLQAAQAGAHPDGKPGEERRCERSWLGVPLIAKGKLIGLLRMEHGEVGHFTPHHAQQALAFANQAAVAIQNARLYEQAQKAATIEERQRLSRELHDSISQALYGIVLGARTALTQVERDPQAAADPLRFVLALAETALAEMRAMIFELRPDSLETEGLVAALLRQADLARARHGLAVEAELGEEPALSLDAKEALYRIAKEAINNIVHHAQAQRATLRLRSEAEYVTLEVVDDGRGFDISALHPGHMGLQSMRERAERAGGAWEVESRPGEGATVRVRVRRRDPPEPPRAG